VRWPGVVRICPQGGSTWPRSDTPGTWGIGYGAKGIVFEVEGLGFEAKGLGLRA
jgi:hypothetical protein